MGKFRGTVRKNDLEGGHWQLVADDGKTYVLQGALRVTSGRKITPS